MRSDAVLDLITSDGLCERKKTERGRERDGESERREETGQTTPLL